MWQRMGYMKLNLKSKFPLFVCVSDMFTSNIVLNRSQSSLTFNISDFCLTFVIFFVCSNSSLVYI